MAQIPCLCMFDPNEVIRYSSCPSMTTLDELDTLCIHMGYSIALLALMDWGAIHTLWLHIDYGSFRCIPAHSGMNIRVCIYKQVEKALTWR